MSTSLILLLICAGDLLSASILSHATPSRGPQAVDISFSLFRVLLCVCSLVFPSNPRVWTWFLSCCVALSFVPSVLEVYSNESNKSNEHARFAVFAAISFSALEACWILIVKLSRPMERAGLGEEVEVKIVDERKDIERGLLLGEEDGVEDAYKGTGATWRRLVALAYPERWILTVATFALFVSSAASVVTPALFGRIIQTISVTKDEEELNKTTLLLIFMFVVTSVFSLVRGALYTLAGERLVARFRVRLFDAMMHQDLEFFDKNQSGELTSRLSNDTSQVQNAVTVNISMFLRYVLSAVISLIIVFIISWKLTLIMLSIVPILAISAKSYGTLIKNVSKNYQDALAKASECAEEAFGNNRTVRTFCKEDYEVARYRERIEVSYEQGRLRAWGYGIFIGFIGMVAYLSVTLVLYIGGRMVIHNTSDFSSADLTAFLLYTLQLLVSLGGLSELYGTLLTALGASDRLFNILDIVPQITSRRPPGSLALANVPRFVPTTHGATIEFRDVEFSYPTRLSVKVLNGVSFSALPGSTIAFCGSSGGGKSTIVSLLQRFYDPSSGVIYVDGRNIKDMHPIELRSKMSVVQQEPALFASSIADNIAYGVHRIPSREEIVDAARKANALDFIEGFPEKFDTLVGERGIQLSGGQKQRLALARSFLADPEILVLDEFTSALDANSEALVKQALETLMKGRTTLVIAHRLSTVRNAMIFVLDKGTIVERGTFKELAAIPSGLFASLVIRQLQE